MFKEMIIQLAVPLIYFFNAGIIFRIITILGQAQTDENVNYKKLIRNHVIIAIMVNSIFSIISLVKSYYGY